MFFFLKLSLSWLIFFVVHAFITYKSLYWFTEKIKDLFLCDTDYVSYCAIESEWIRSLWAGVCKIFFKNLFEDTLDLELCWKRDSTLGAFLPVLWILHNTFERLPLANNQVKKKLLRIILQIFGWLLLDFLLLNL